VAVPDAPAHDMRDGPQWAPRNYMIAQPLELISQLARLYSHKNMTDPTK